MIRRGMRSEIVFLLGIFFLFALFHFYKRRPFPGFNVAGADTVLSPLLPRRGNCLTRAIGRLVYTLLGWRIEGQLPDVPKLVIVAAPHTSHWDAVLAIGFFLATGLDCRWMIKREACDHPLGGLMRWMGAIPVNRQTPGNLAQEVIDEMNRNEKFVLAIAPEGTRKKVERWKTGFYRIALATGTPITLAYADFGQRVAGIGPTLQPSGEMETQIEEMQAYFRGITPRNSESA